MFKNPSLANHIYLKHIFFYQLFSNISDKIVTIVFGTSKKYHSQISQNIRY